MAPHSAPTVPGAGDGSALEQLAAFHERAGQLAEAESAIRRLLEYDPLSESAYRQLMRVLARADQRSAALDDLRNMPPRAGNRAWPGPGR
jgi:DNA-binding SARP family transcriptional activator